MAETKTKRTAPTARVRFFKDKKKEWRWQCRAPNGRIIADSAEGYVTLTKCQHGWSMLDVYLQRGISERIER